MFKFILSLILTSSLSFAAKHHQENPSQAIHLEPWHEGLALHHQQESFQERYIIDVIHAIRQLQNDMVETGDTDSLDDFMAFLETTPSQEEFDQVLVQNILGQSASGILERLERWYATTIDRPSVYYREGAKVFLPSSGESGRILTIDERRGVATVELDTWGWWNTKETHLLRELAVASGCLKEELCIAQRVFSTSGKWNQHTIEAIDYFANRVVVTRVAGARKISILSPDELVLRRGCLERTHGENFCVGDSFPIQGQGEKYPSRAEIVGAGQSILLVQYYSFDEDTQGPQMRKREFLRPDQLDRMILSHGNH